MKIILENFKCFESKEFDIPDTGLILLDGESGHGKSSLLKSIIWALWGKVKKPCMHGKKSCKVTLYFLGLKIIRTYNPNKLECGKLIDTTAQEYINDKFMTYSDFILSSYIPQKENTSIVSMAPTQQIETLQKLTFDKNTLNMYSNIKTKIDELSNEIIGINAQINFIEKDITKKIELIENIKISESNIIKFNKTNKDDLNIEYNKNRSRLDKYLEKFSEINEEMYKQINIRDSLKNNKEKLSDLRKIINKLKQEYDSYTYKIKEFDEKDCNQEYLQNLTNQYNYLLLNEEIKKLKHEYQEYYDEEFLELNNKLQSIYVPDIDDEKIDNIKRQLDLAELDNKIDKELKNNNIKILRDIETIKSEIENLNKLHVLYNINKNQKKLACPGCGIKLCYSYKGNLIENNYENSQLKDHTETLKKLNKELELTQKKLDMKKSNNSGDSSISSDCDYNKLLNDYNKLQELKIESKIQEKKKNDIIDLLENLKKGNVSFLIKLKKQINDKTSKLSNLKIDLNSFNTKNTNNNDINNLKETISKLNQTIKDKEYIENKIDNIQNELNDNLNKKEIIRNTIESLKKEINEKSIEEYNIELENITKKINKLKLEHKDLEKLKNDFEKFEQYNYKKNELETLKNDLHKVKDQLNTKTDELLATETLKKRYKQAEILSLESIVHTINAGMSKYLNYFFQDNVQVYLSSKLNKTTKINTNVILKGKKSTMGDLSGGEYDRVTLASIITINEMLNSRILILDEALNSLHQESNTEILQFLKEQASNKLILIISHNVINGIFDTGNIINL